MQKPSLFINFNIRHNVIYQSILKFNETVLVIILLIILFSYFIPSAYYFVSLRNKIL